MPAAPVAAVLNRDAVPAYVMGGKSTVTVVNNATGGRYTFRVEAPRRDRETGERQRPEDANVRFVSVLTGADNEHAYDFLGMLFSEGEDRPPRYVHSAKKSRISPDAPSARVARWFFAHVFTGLPPSVEVWHAGRCSRCGRLLTVPSSIAVGLGPECQNAGAY